MLHCRGGSLLMWPWKLAHKKACLTDKLELRESKEKEMCYIVSLSLSLRLFLSLPLSLPTSLSLSLPPLPLPPSSPSPSLSPLSPFRYANLERLADDRRQRLEESKKRFVLSREMNELKHWITDKVKTIIISSHVL